MRILFIAPRYSGAGGYAYRIAQKLKKSGFEKALKEKNLDMDKIKKYNLFHVFNLTSPLLIW